MFQNLKVDVIYYKTNTDFEMEFNLCGCCRMRLLTDKTPDKQTMVHSLARAVSRSRIILVIGSLFGDNSIIKTAADAIGYSLSTLDCKKYGVNSDDKISIIDGATPLVTADGLFGGIIIESGPQTMILLTDNKSVRKTVMQTLIHPYLEELCATELKEKAAENRKPENDENDNFYADSPLIIPDSQEDDIKSYDESEIETDLLYTEEENIGPEFDLVNAEESYAEENETMDPEFRLIPSEENEEENDELPELSDEDKAFAETILSNTDFTPREIDEGEKPLEEESDLIFKSKPDSNEEEKEPEIPLEMTECDSSIIYDEDYEEISSKSTKANKPKAGLTIAILCLAIFLLLVLVVLCYCVIFIPSLQGTSPTKYIKEIFSTIT